MSGPVKPAAGKWRGKPKALPPAWTGITGPYCWQCAWSWRDGRREIKFISDACPVHRTVPVAGSGAPEGGEGA